MSFEKIIDKKNTNLSKRIDKKKVPEHVAIIMDGNGRWATRQGLPRSFGHNKGVSVLKTILKASKELGCKVMLDGQGADDAARLSHFGPTHGKCARD